MALLRLLWFVPLLVVVTALCAVAAIVAGYLDPHRRWALHIVPLWSRLLLLAGGVEVRTEGDLAALGKAAAVYVANHQSYLDIMVLSFLLPPRLLWLAKRELFSIPVFGQAMRAVGQIPVDRGDRDAARASIELAAQQVRRGFPVVLFPEGTRSADGTMRPFKVGFVHLAAASGAPVVPLVVRGTGALWPRGAWGTRPGTVTVTVLPPRHPGTGAASEEPRQWAQRLRAEMVAARSGE